MATIISSGAAALGRSLSVEGWPQRHEGGGVAEPSCSSPARWAPSCGQRAKFAKVTREARLGTHRHPHVIGGPGSLRIPLSQHRLGNVTVLNAVDDEFREEAATYGEDGGESLPVDKNLAKEVKIDLQLPRRRLLVEFTCNVCQTRTQRLINPDAYKRGTVYVQCGGCETYHQLVDNLGLVVEYDFRKEIDSTSS